MCKEPRIGNTFFTGNCFGTIMPFLGFGQFDSILTGIYAAEDLSGNGSYPILTKSIRKSYERSLTLRRAMEKLSNNSYDLLVKQLNGPIGKRLFKPSRRDPLKIASYLIRPFL
ncbi:hypothetical protein ACFQ3N_18635 [Virgibacillus byunsanensis]|uniref:Uncharacterized protein n=2 Tax=Virgibacillus byunsanensis TaxID=570945 RepID=A0ABW3LPU5_9BACI